MTAAMAVPAIFSALMTTFQTAPHGIDFSQAISGARGLFLKLIP
jgi:hypothetical protein